VGPSWLKGSDPNFTINVFGGQPGALATVSTDLEFPGLQFSIRQGEVKDLPDDPEAAAFILARVYIPEVPEPQSETMREDT
jgi:hypothetical protein